MKINKKILFKSIVIYAICVLNIYIGLKLILFPFTYIPIRNPLSNTGVIIYVVFGVIMIGLMTYTIWEYTTLLLKDNS